MAIFNKYIGNSLKQTQNSRKLSLEIHSKMQNLDELKAIEFRLIEIKGYPQLFQSIVNFFVIVLKVFPIFNFYWELL